MKCFPLFTWKSKEKVATPRLRRDGFKFEICKVGKSLSTRILTSLANVTSHLLHCWKKILLDIFKTNYDVKIDSAFVNGKQNNTSENISYFTPTLFCQNISVPRAFTSICFSDTFWTGRPPVLQICQQNIWYWILQLSLLPPKQLNTLQNVFTECC